MKKKLNKTLEQIQITRIQIEHQQIFAILIKKKNILLQFVIKKNKIICNIWLRCEVNFNRKKTKIHSLKKQGKKNIKIHIIIYFKEN